MDGAQLVNLVGSSGERLGLIDPGDWLDQLERHGFESLSYHHILPLKLIG